MAFLQDLLLAYRDLVNRGNGTADLPPLNAEQLRHRNDFPLTSKSLGQWLYRTGFGLREAAKFTLRKITPLAMTTNKPKRNTKLGFIQITSDPDLLRALRRAAAQSGTTLNDLLLRDFLATMGDWNREHETGTAGRFRLLVPCDLRLPEHTQTPAANILGYAFLTRTIEECRDSPELLSSVQGEMAFIRDTNASLYFLRCLRVASLLPGGIAGIGRSHGCFATSMLSNIGDPTRYFSPALPRSAGKLISGGLQLEGLIAFPPLRSGTHFGAVLTTYAGRISIGLHYDPRYFNEPDAADFGNRFLTMITHTSDQAAL